ncbi:MAG TPA: CCA tRNA nucleotidyltransferase, partial [Pseudonocardiaceae bacterium]
MGRAQQNAVVELLRIAPVADELAARFIAAGHALYLVGGSVRDALLGRLGSRLIAGSAGSRQIAGSAGGGLIAGSAGGDLDFTTDARPDAIAALLRGWADAVWDTGIAFGTVGASKGGIQCEITTYRADRYDRVSRNPEVVFGDTVEDDLARRDFTVNAMAVALPLKDHGRFVDPHGGMAALARRELDTPATPEESFADDPLRMLRAARFVSQLGFTLVPRVREALVAMAGEISRITAERVAAELSKLMLGADPRAGVELMVDTGLAAYV